MDHASEMAAGAPAARRPAAIALMISGQSYGGIVFAVPLPVMAALAQAYGGGTQGAFNAQLAVALPSLGMMLAGLVSGWLFENGGLRRPILLSMLSLAVFGSALLFVNAPWLMLGTRLLLGVAAGLLGPAIALLVAETYAGAERARVLGYQVGTGSLSMLAVLLLSGLIAQEVGWRAPFAVYALVGLGGFALAFATVPDRRPVVTANEEVAWKILTHLWVVYLSAGLFFIVAIGAGGKVPLLLSRNGVGSPFVQSVVVSAVTAFSALGAMTYGRVRRSLGGRWTYALSLSTCGAGMIVIGLSRGALDAALGSILVGAGMGLCIPHFWSTTAEIAPDAARGRAMGYLSTVMFFGGFTYPFVFAPLERAFGMGGACVALGATLAAAALGFALARRGPFSGR